MSIYMGLGALVLILAILGRRLWTNGQYHGLTEGMLAGYDEGDRDGFNRGYAQAALDHVLAQSTETEHFADVMSSLGDCAEDGSLAFAEALLSGKLREAVGEDAQQ